MVLAHKNKIRQSFKDYTANLSYDLSVYKNIFDSLDAEIQCEPENIKKEVQKAIIETEGKNFISFLDDKLEELGRIVSKFSKEEKRKKLGEEDSKKFITHATLVHDFSSMNIELETTPEEILKEIEVLSFSKINHIANIWSYRIIYNT